MANLTRYKQKIFANNSNQVGVFGTGTDKVASKNVETLQSADYEDGWSSAIVTNKNYPVWQERDGVDYGFSYQLAYLLQKGIPDWLSTETYYQNDYCKVGNAIYYSLQDNNVGHNPSNTSGYWSIFASSSRNIGEIVPSTIPLTDAGLHLLDGTLISGSGSYSAFVDYIADLYDSGDYTAIFDTEANWQAAVTLSGVCDKFVYDSVNQTVRLPKYGNQIWSGGGNAPVIGNGTSLGFTTGSINSGVVYSGSGSNLFCGYTGVYGEPVGTNYTGSTTVGANKSIGLTTDSTKSGIIADLANITTSLDGYYYIVVATSTKTQIQVDIDEIATDLNGKMDKDGTNAVSSVKFADGQWAGSESTLIQTSSNVAVGTYTYDLSSWLPNDNYKYMVHVFVYISARNVNYTGIILNGEKFLDGDAYAASNDEVKSAVGDIIVDTTRVLTMKIENQAPTGLGLFAIRYRRIGTNQ